MRLMMTIEVKLILLIDLIGLYLFDNLIKISLSIRMYLYCFTYSKKNG